MPRACSEQCLSNAPLGLGLGLEVPVLSPDYASTLILAPAPRLRSRPRRSRFPAACASCSDGRIGRVREAHGPSSTLPAGGELGIRPKGGPCSTRERTQRIIGRSRSAESPPVTIYALFVCSQLLKSCESVGPRLPAPGAPGGSVPNVFASLALCRRYSAHYLGGAPDTSGRWHKSRGGWFECLERQLDAWHEPGQ
jgi:hypothetical protein